MKRAQDSTLSGRIFKMSVMNFWPTGESSRRFASSWKQHESRYKLEQPSYTKRKRKPGLTVWHLVKNRWPPMLKGSASRS